MLTYIIIQCYMYIVYTEGEIEHYFSNIDKSNTIQNTICTQNSFYLNVHKLNKYLSRVFIYKVYKGNNYDIKAIIMI